MSSTLAARGPALAFQTALSVVIGLLATVVWALTGGGYYWPVWVWLGLGLPFAFHLGMAWSLGVRGSRRALRIIGSLSAILSVLLLCLWAGTGAGTYWPVYAQVTLAGITAIFSLIVNRHRLWPSGREEELVGRVDELTRTRRGALDAQAAELRRIERDLHDGAQARLVALSMQLGRAEERLDDQPEVAALVRRARGEAVAAIGELRDLARGIAPPVLADRGLAAAVEALAKRSAIPVDVHADIARRPVPVVETAAYFVAAEGLTNVAKHAPGARAQLDVVERDGILHIEIADDGPGGADPHGAGLTGLRNRVEALDGILEVRSRDGRGTTLKVELPCGS
jgi:signal transduction histidine kinase